MLPKVITFYWLFGLESHKNITILGRWLGQQFRDARLQSSEDVTDVHPFQLWVAMSDTTRLKHRLGCIASDGSDGRDANRRPYQWPNAVIWVTLWWFAIFADIFNSQNTNISFSGLAFVCLGICRNFYGFKERTSDTIILSEADWRSGRQASGDFPWALQEMLRSQYRPIELLIPLFNSSPVITFITQIGRFIDRSVARPVTRLCPSPVRSLSSLCLPDGHLWCAED